MIVERLKALGVPVTVHEPEIYLSIPFEAAVKAGGRTMRAKPPAYSVSAPDGITAEIAYVPAQYSKSIGTLFDKNAQDASRRRRSRGRIVVSEGFAFPQKIREFEEMGAVGVIAVNPGVDIHWGICTSIWGTPDLDDLPRKPKIPVAAVNNPDGRELIKLAGTGEKVTLTTRLEEGWYRQKLPGRRDPGHRRAGKVRAPARPLRFLGRRRRRQRHGRRDPARDRARSGAAARSGFSRSVRIAWWPGHSTGPLRRLDLVRRRLRDRPRRELRRADQLRLARLPLGDRLQGRILDEGNRSLRAADHQGRDRARRAGRAPAPGRRLLLQQHRHLEPVDAVLDHAGRTARGEGLLHGRRLRREHRLAYRERRRWISPTGTSCSATSRSISRSTAGIADADVLPFDWRDAGGRVRRRRSTRYHAAAGGLFDLGAGEGGLRVARPRARCLLRRSRRPGGSRPAAPTR